MYSDRTCQETRLTFIYAALLGALTVGYRLVAPYKLLGPGSEFVWNLMPVGALALFIGANLRSRWGWLIPLAAMVVSDLLLIPVYGRDSISWYSTPFIYASFALYVLIGRIVRPSIDSPLSLLGSSLAGSVQFFVISNFSVWLFGLTVNLEPYPKTLSGLIDCYVMAIPFCKGTFTSDLLFTSLFFAGYAAVLSVSRSSAPQEAV